MPRMRSRRSSDHHPHSTSSAMISMATISSCSVAPQFFQRPSPGERASMSRRQSIWSGRRIPWERVRRAHLAAAAEYRSGTSRHLRLEKLPDQVECASHRRAADFSWVSHRLMTQDAPAPSRAAAATKTRPTGLPSSSTSEPAMPIMATTMSAGSARARLPPWPARLRR